MRNPRTGRDWQPPLANAGHQLVALGPPDDDDKPAAWLCISCWGMFSRWAIIEGYLPRCRGGVAQLKGETHVDTR